MQKKIHVAPGIKALIFDFDGTLADTMPVHFKAWQSVAKEFGFSFSQKDFFDLAGVPTREIIEKMAQEQGLNLPISDVVAAKKQGFMDRIDEITPIPRLIEVVHKHQGILPMAIASGSYRELVEKSLTAIKLDRHFFKSLVTAEDVTRHKPDPEIFLLAASQLGVEPKFCQVFEDADLGIEAARAAGMTVTDVRE